MIPNYCMNCGVRLTPKYKIEEDDLHSCSCSKCKYIYMVQDSINQFGEECIAITVESFGEAN